jgi:hypothetical protein
VRTDDARAQAEEHAAHAERHLQLVVLQLLEVVQHEQQVHDHEQQRRHPHVVAIAAGVDARVRIYERVERLAVLVDEAHRPLQAQRVASESARTAMV